MRRYLVLAIVAGCAPAAPQVATQPQPPPSEPPPPSPWYTPDEALADAAAGPLELVGADEWGRDNRLACVYRNARVFVIDEQCSEPVDGNSLVVHVVSPTRGRVEVHAEAAPSSPIRAVRRRADYATFWFASRPVERAPATLTLAMSHGEVFAYMRGRISREPGTALPLSADFEAKADAFLREPPPPWYAIVGAVLDARKRTQASTRPAAIPADRLAAWGTQWASENRIRVDTDPHNIARIGNPDGLSAAIAATADGGLVVVGTTRDKRVTVPAAARIDADGNRRWWTALPQKGFKTHEATAVLALPDGALVLAQGYPNPAWKAVWRVIRLDDGGAVRWEWAGHGKDKHKVPQLVVARVSPQGTFLLHGYIQLVADGDVHVWTGELDDRGRLVRDEVGRVLADHAASCAAQPLGCL